MSGIRHEYLSFPAGSVTLAQPAMRAGPRGDKHVSTALVDQAVDAFAAVLVRWRGARGRSKKQLAADMGFDPSYVSHVEARRHRPTEDFARRAEIVLDAGGEIWERFRHFDQLRQASSGLRVRPEPTVPEQWRPILGRPDGRARGGSTDLCGW